MTVGSLLTDVTGFIGDVAPDMSIYIGAGVVAALGFVLFKKFVKGAR